MLRKWAAPGVTYTGQSGAKYTVLAISPDFGNPLGTSDPNGQIPYWGTGTGTLTVDYRATSTDFWRIVTDTPPVAIMSFSRGATVDEWKLETFATNWANQGPNNVWVTTLTYNDTNGQPQQGQWARPYVGGSTNDPAPPSVGQSPITGGPPDPTRPADFSSATLKVPANAVRYSNLPMSDIVAAIKADPVIGPKLNEYVDDGSTVPLTGPGTFVSNFMAYHVVWYREWWNGTTKGQDAPCRYSGHTHVGILIDPADAAAAVEIQLQELLKKL